ncbi:MarR family winged helix-turn-helix transcriptional regulator [Rhodospirillum rubrum]|uniref:Transcriptional regulator, MarR family n=2 Tax=Rhodospirillum rubrum TaxID=1085 RepID=Q2RYG9_RHORT|nr:MarR family winged helix-turn-helix transcriptional regulator [Rhodospirillum rubrum]ABC20826.1 transcriptional regulator, MarR family [Rhodospirillum rubrum ATCC 11170]AEO46493.1 MarR family transcriptional regulator [Rhodospirillum rubrum F11]MBK5956349.1 MarR family transcriptional regulator [Rhodospirillum rubrum]
MPVPPILACSPSRSDPGAVADEDLALRLDRQICFPLYAASNLMTRLYRPLLESLGLTYPQYLVMMVLWEVSRCRVGDLGARLHLDSGTLTPLLKRMEAAGLVNRRRDSADERRVEVSLTEHGQALRLKARSVPEGVITALDLPRERALALGEELRALVDVLATALDHRTTPSPPGDKR